MQTRGNELSTGEERCDCGKLLFKISKRGLEFKCNRCKRIHLVPLTQIDSEFKNLCPVVNTSVKRPSETT